MKKTLLAISSVAALQALLSGCGGTPSNNAGSPQKVETVEFWYALPGESGDVVKKLVQSFNDAHKNIHVNATYVPTNERLQKLTAALGAGNPPDLYTAGPPDVGQLAGNDQVAAIDDLTNGKLKADMFYPGPRGVAEANKKLVAVPVSAGVVGLYYNKDLFDKNGITSPPQTWDELIADAKKVTDESKGQYGIILPTSPDVYTTSIWQCFLWQNGGDLISSDGKKAIFNSNEGVEALQLWVDLVQKYKVAPLLNLSQDTSIQTFGKGQSGMVPAMPLFVESVKKFPFQTVTSVLPKAKKQASTLGGWYLTIPKKSQHQQAAAELLQWLIQPENVTQWNIGTGSVPTSSGVKDSQPYQSYLKQTPNAGAFVQSMDFAKAPPAIPQYSSISKLIAEAISKALYQKLTPKEALDEAAKKADALLQGN